MGRTGGSACPAPWTLQEILSFSVPEKSIYLALLQVDADWEMEVRAQPWQHVCSEPVLGCTPVSPPLCFTIPWTWGSRTCESAALTQKSPMGLIQAPPAVVDPVASQQCHEAPNSLSVAFPAAWGGVGAPPLCWGLCWRSVPHRILHHGEQGCMDPWVGSRVLGQPRLWGGCFFFSEKPSPSLLHALQTLCSALGASW